VNSRRAQLTPKKDNYKVAARRGTEEIATERLQI